MLKLAVSGLKAYYFTEKGPVKAVDGVNLQLSGSESMGIVGESACGKSTLGAALMRSMQPPGKIVGGTIMLNDNDILKMAEQEFNGSVRWKKIAMVFQGAMNALDPVYSVESQLQEILKEHGFGGNVEEKISESLSAVGLDPSVARRYPHERIGAGPRRPGKKKNTNFVGGPPPPLPSPPAGCRFYARCPHAMDVCKKDPPEFPTKTGYVRCWLYEIKPET